MVDTKLDVFLASILQANIFSVFQIEILNYIHNEKKYLNKFNVDVKIVNLYKLYFEMSSLGYNFTKYW